MDLIDNSNSLIHTDPSFKRVVGIKAELAGLARLSERGNAGKKIDVEVRLVSFASDYRSTLGDDGNRAVWRQVTPASLRGLLASVDSIRNQPLGEGTDHVTALLGAEADLANKSAEITANGGPSPCKALVWFTDGQYDIPLRTAHTASALGWTLPYAPNIRLDSRENVYKAMARGIHVMCDPGGVIDQLRDDEVRVFSLTLDTELKVGAAHFLQAASGGTPYQTCGHDLRNDSGLYLTASKGERLQFIFGGLIDTPAPVRFCPVRGHAVCTFPATQGISSFALEIATPSAGDEVILTSPSGQKGVFRPGDAQDKVIGSTRVVQEWFSGQAVDLDANLTPTASDWRGLWKLTFLSHAVTGVGQYTVRLRTNLHPELLAPNSLVAGSLSHLRLALGMTPNGGALPRALVQRGTLSASVADPSSGARTTLHLRRTALNEWTADYRPPLSIRAPQLALVLDTSFDLGPSVTVATEERDILLPVGLPSDLPRVEQTVLPLPSVRGRQTTRGVVTIIGPRRGEGCVWLAGGDFLVSRRIKVGAAKFSPDPVTHNSCLHIPAGARRNVSISVAPAVARSGRAEGNILFHLQGSLTRNVHITALPAAFDMSIPPNTERAVAIFILLLVAGILLPLCLLWMVNWWGARFAPPHLLRYFARDVEVTPGGELLAASSAAPRGGTREPIDVSVELLSDETTPPQRHLDVDRGRFRLLGRAAGARGERFPNLFLGPYGVVETSSGAVLAGNSSLPLRAFPSAGRHEVPLPLAGTWIFEPSLDSTVEPGIDHDEGEGRRTVQGRLVVFVSSDAPGDAAAVALRAAESIQIHGDAWEPVSQRGFGERCRSMLSAIRARFARGSRTIEEDQGQEDEDQAPTDDMFDVR